MTDRMHDAFDTRLAAALEDYVARAYDPRPAAVVAGVAMRPRGLKVRIMPSGRSRRFLLLGLAATLVVPTAYLGALLVRQSDPETVDPGTYQGVFIRRDESIPGIVITEVRGDGAEREIRRVPDATLPAGNKFAAWGTLAPSGWLAAAEQNSPWHVVLINLRDEAQEPWIIDQGNAGGIGPQWGPTGVLAVFGGFGSEGQGHGVRLVIVDPVAHTINPIRTQANLPGGGPNIAWTADGSGIVGYVYDSNQPNGVRYVTMPLDGGANIEGTPIPANPAIGGEWGLASRLRVCPLPGENADQCAAAPPGAIELVLADGSTSMLYPNDYQPDRALSVAVSVDGRSDWVLFDRGSGRQLVLRRFGRSTGASVVVASIDRAADWQYIGLAAFAPDESLASFSIYNDHDGVRSGLMLPTSGSAEPSFHTGSFVGYMEVGDLERAASGEYASRPSVSIPAGGARYQLPSVDELIAEEVARNPGVVVQAQGGSNGVPGSTETQVTRIELGMPGQSDINLYCVGAGPVTVSLNGNTLVTNSCASPNPAGPGGEWRQFNVGDLVEVRAPAETAWRLFVFCYPDVSRPLDCH